jgi:hypothetical protein
MYSATITRPKLQSAVLKSLFSEDYNFEQVTIPANSQCNAAALFDVGTVLGKIGRGAITVSAATFAGTGNGVLTPANPAYGVKAQVGNYLVTFDAPETNAGEFLVIRPDGTVDGKGKVGVAYNGDVKFTIADGSADFVAGDQFTIPVAVAAGSAKYVAHDPAAIDGSQLAAAVVARGVTVGAADTPVVIVARGPATLLADGLVWKTGIAGNDQAAALAALAAAGIIVRNS